MMVIIKFQSALAYRPCGGRASYEEKEKRKSNL